MIKNLNSITITRKHIFIVSCVTAFIVVCYALFSHLGVNVTPSVPFRFYYHTSLNGHKLERGDYILFKFPKNQLYENQKLPVVKEIACLTGQNLQTYQGKDKIIYACNGTVVSELKRFKRPNGDRLDIFIYNGIIPPNNYFVIGASEDSYDSKYWGFVPYANILRIVHPIAQINFVSNVFAADFYSDRDRGWYKYEIVPEKPDNETVYDNLTYAHLVKPEIPSLEELSTMPSEKFAKLFKDVQDYAMSYRTLENFDTFAKMRSVMVARALEFTNVGTLWAQLNPEDTGESWFPNSGFGQDAYRTQANQLRLSYIQENKDNFGLIYFFRPDCQYCQKQTPLIQYFEDMTGWIVKRVNTNEMPQAMLRFNIQTVPSIILLERETKRFLPVSNGIMTYEEIEERLYRTIKYLKGESDEKNFGNPIRPDNFINK